MSKIKSKRTNRIISIASLGVFAFALLLIGFLGFKLINEYQKNLTLQKQKDELIQEQARLEELSDLLSDDDYYSVYVDDDLISVNTEIIIIIF